jgi:hypothetical protein
LASQFLDYYTFRYWFYKFILEFKLQNVLEPEKTGGHSNGPAARSGPSRGAAASDNQPSSGPEREARERAHNFCEEVLTL